MRWQKTTWLAVFLFLALAGRSHAQPYPIANGTFDSDVTGWEPSPTSIGILEWTGGQGRPPGALKIVGPDQEAFLQDCFHFAPGSIYFTADAFMETRGEFVVCSLNFAMYRNSTDCTGYFSSFVILDDIPQFPIVENPNQWEHLVLDVPLPDDVTETRVLSFRPMMAKFGDSQGDDACIFDNATMWLVPRATVPALGPVGFVVFAALLTLAALLVLRHPLTPRPDPHANCT
jgi:hypothetical protein